MEGYGELHDCQENHHLQHCFSTFVHQGLKKHALWLATNILPPYILRVKESQNKMTKSCCNINNISHGSGLSMSLMH